MPISNPRELQQAVEKAGVLLQEIHDYCTLVGKNRREFPEARVRFPRGFIRPASLQRRRILFLKDRSLKDNIAYTLILSDVILWLQIRTDLWGTPNEMLTKLYVFLIGTLCESITKDYLSGVCGKNYKGRTEYLAKAEIISVELKDELDWLWDTRNRMHLFQLEDREYENDYDTKCHARCVNAFRGLIDSLSAAERPE